MNIAKTLKEVKRSKKKPPDNKTILIIILTAILLSGGITFQYQINQLKQNIIKAQSQSQEILIESKNLLKLIKLNSQVNQGIINIVPELKKKIKNIKKGTYYGSINTPHTNNNNDSD